MRRAAEHLRGRGAALGALLAAWLPLQGPVAQVGPRAPSPAAPGFPGDAAMATDASRAPLAPWTGSAVEGLAEIRRLAGEGRHDEARALARRILVPHGPAAALDAARASETAAALLRPVDPLLEALGWNGPPEETRAEVRYAEGVVAALAGDGDAAVGAFERAVALASDDALRREALYDRGAVLLAGAETLRAEIPELQDPAAALAPAARPPATPGTGEEEPDPLALARGAYRAAKAAFLERLRLDWRDGDTRANLELIQRRLRELDELERQRREQEQQEDSQQEPQEGDEGEPGDPREEQQQDSEGEDSESGEPRDSEGEEGPPEDGGGEDAGGPEETEPEPEESEERQPEESETEGEESETAAEEARPSEEEDERVLTREQVVRLLDRLREIEEQGEAVRARLRQRGRVAVEKDW